MAETRGAHWQASDLEIEAFLDEIEGVCQKYGLSISHEDGHGGFEIMKYDPSLMSWLRDAADCTQTKCIEHDWGEWRRMAYADGKMKRRCKVCREYETKDG